MINNIDDLRLGIIGLGYVGLPLAIEFSKKKNVIGFDINKDLLQYSVLPLNLA